MSSVARRLCIFGLGLYLIVCLLIDFYPHHGPPKFRYTGSDPGRDVWNLGWPIATAIWDPETGLHVAPFAEIQILAQLVLGLLLAGSIALVWASSRGGGSVRNL